MRFRVIAVTAIALAVVFGLSGPAAADKAGNDLLKRCARVMHAAKSFEAEFSWVVEPIGVRHDGKILFRKPRRTLMQYGVTRNGKREFYTIDEDGEWQSLFNPEDPGRDVVRLKAPGWAWRNDWSFGSEYAAFYDPNELLECAPKGSVCTVTGKNRIGGVMCNILTITKNPDYGKVRFYIDGNGILRGTDFVSLDNSGSQLIETRLTNVKVNVPLPDEAFKWTLPADVKLPKAD
jgi:outer membrane lipoprotein-sorting protein